MASEFGSDFDRTSTLEAEFVNTCKESFSDFLKLLGDNREHLNQDTIEFIKTGPAALLGKASEMTLHHLIINLVRAIVDNTKTGDTFCKIFGRFGFTCACRSRWVGAEFDMEGTRNGDPALISQGSDDKTRSGAHILVAVGEYLSCFYQLKS